MQKPRNGAAFWFAFFPLNYDEDSGTRILAHEVRVVTGHASSQHLDRYVNLDPADVARKPI